MKSIDSYLLREPVKEKEIIAYFAGAPVYAGDDYREELWYIGLERLRRLNNVPKWLLDTLSEMEERDSRKCSQERMRANMMNAHAGNAIAIAEQEKKQARAKSVIDAIFLKLFR